MTTINLRDGLEALYYFGEQDFNPQRNQLQDHSGYGRHATANGSVTIGNTGVNDFEAAEFNNGYFNVGHPLDVSGSQTTAALVKYDTPNSGDFNVVYDSEDRFEGIEMGVDEYGDYYNKFRDEDFNGIKLTSDASEDWVLQISVFTGNELRLIINNELTASSSVTGHSAADINVRIGVDNSNTNGYFDGKIAFISRHSRALSGVEIERLNDLTAPLRAQL